MSNIFFSIPAVAAITILANGPCKRYDKLITAILKNNKVYLLGDYTTTDVISFKRMGFRFNPKKDLFANYEIYVKHRSKLKKEVIESDELYEFLASLKQSFNKKDLNHYLDKECPFKLYEFQKEFVYWYNNPEITNYACFNASSAGVGKTVMTLAAVLSKNINQPLVILCPKNAISVWKEHLEKFNYSLPIKDSFEPGECACVLTYESLNPSQTEANEKKRSIESFKKELPRGSVLIADEFHKTKSAKTKTTKRFKKLFKLFKSREGKCIALTATPIMNRPQEFKTLLDNLDLLKISFGNAEYFNKLFGGQFNMMTKRLTFNHNIRNVEEIQKRVKSILFIKRKEDVLEQLPDKQETFIHVPVRATLLKQLNQLGSAEKLLAIVNSPLFTEYTKFREILSIEKVKEIEDLLESYEEQDKPVIVYSAFTQCIRTIGNRNGWAYIDGSIDPAKRAIIICKFNSGKLKGLAISSGSGATALSITGTDTIIFLDLSLTPGINYQCRHRIDRINSIKSALHYVYIISDHPFEKEMHNIILRKEKLELDTLGFDTSGTT